MIPYQLFRLNPFYAAWEDRMMDVFDLVVWSMLQSHYMPHYVVGKQDEWRDWVGLTLNGLGPKSYSICKI